MRDEKGIILISEDKENIELRLRPKKTQIDARALKEIEDINIKELFIPTEEQITQTVVE